MSAGRETGTGPPVLTEGQFRQQVLDSDIPVLVAFSAGWCAPCAWLVPYLEEVMAAAGDTVKVVKVDADEAPTLFERYGVASLPTVIRFQGGSETERSLGVEPERLRRMAGLALGGQADGNV